MAGVINETPRLDGLTPARRAPEGFIEDFLAGREAQLNIENFNAEQHFRSRVWRDYLDLVEERSGERFPHPDHFIAEVDVPALFGVGAASEDNGGVAGAKAAWVQERVGRLREERPELGLPGPEWMEERLRAEAERLDSRAADAEFLPSFAGHIAGAFQDPVTLVTMPFGGGEASLLRTFLTEAGINGLLAAGQEPLANRWREELGLETATLTQSAQNVVISAAAGGALGTAPRAAGRGIDAARSAFARLSPRDLARAARELSGEDEAVAAAARHMDDLADAADENPFDPGDGVNSTGVEAQAEHETRLQDAVRAVTDPDPEQAAAAASRLDEPASMPLREDVEPLRPAGMQNFDPRTLEVDAARFQFKAGGDEAGVTDRLRDVTEWDPVRAGIAVVYEDASGRRFIVDGHQRRGLAARILENDPDADVALTGFLYREADGVTDAQVRARAAAKNLAEGTGTAIDAAKVLRADPTLLDASLPQRSALIRDARDLMGLSDEAFGVIVNEVVPARYGAIVGRMIEDGAEQMAVLDALARLEPSSAFEAEAIVRQAREAGFRRAEGDTLSLFGEDPGLESLVGARAKVLSRAARLLRSEKQVFSTLSREADRIEAAGNQLARGQNAERAQTDATLLEILQTLAHRKGPVSDALTRATQDGANTAASARAFLADLRSLAESGDLGRLLPGGAGRGADAAPSDGSPHQAGRLTPEDPAQIPQDGFDGGLDDGARRAQVDRLGAESKAADQDENFDADLFLGPDERSGGRTMTRAEVEAEIEKDLAAAERARICSAR